MTVSVAGSVWHLRREHYVWIPAGYLHEMSFTDDGELLSVYADVRLRPRGTRWDHPHVLRTDPVAEALLWHLQTAPRSLERRRLCMELLHDVLQGADIHHDALGLPRDPRAREVANALLHDPTDTRELRDWAGKLGVSERTLSRGFRANGLSFREWRAQARLHAAASLLERGGSVGAVAESVGYANTSAFIAAFASRFGRTPGAYSRTHAQRGDSR